MSGKHDSAIAQRRMHEWTLIIKAGRRWADDSADTRPIGRQRARARLETYGEVAADVLHMCPAPYAFAMAVQEAMKAHPFPRIAGIGIERANIVRNAWEGEFFADVQRRLGNEDQRHGPGTDVRARRPVRDEHR